MLVTVFFVGANIFILVTSVVINILELSLTDFVSNIRQQHRCSHCEALMIIAELMLFDFKKFIGITLDCKRIISGNGPVHIFNFYDSLASVASHRIPS